MQAAKEAEIERMKKAQQAQVRECVCVCVCVDVVGVVCCVCPTTLLTITGGRGCPAQEAACRRGALSFVCLLLCMLGCCILLCRCLGLRFAMFRFLCILLRFSCILAGLLVLFLFRCVRSICSLLLLHLFLV